MQKSIETPRNFVKRVQPQQRNRDKGDSSSTITMLRMADIIKYTGLARSTVYDHISKGTFPPPIENSSPRHWPNEEINLLNRARIAGYTETDIKELVRMIVEKRKEAIPPLRELIL